MCVCVCLESHHSCETSPDCVALQGDGRIPLGYKTKKKCFPVDYPVGIHHVCAHYEAVVKLHVAKVCNVLIAVNISIFLSKDSCSHL